MSENRIGIGDQTFNAQGAFEAQLHLDAERNKRTISPLGNWAQTFRNMFGGNEPQPSITVELTTAAEFSPEAAMADHLLDVRRRYSELASDPITDRIRGNSAGSYIDLNDTEVLALVPSYGELVENLSLSTDGSHLLEEGKNGKTTLSADAKALATSLIDRFHSQTIDSSEYDLQTLFSHQLKLMYQALKHDENNPDLNMGVVRRIFSSARGQYSRHMEVLESKRLTETAPIVEPVQETQPTVVLEAPRRRPLEFARRFIGATIGAGLLGLAINGYIDTRMHALPTRAEAAAVSTHTPTTISPTETTRPNATATLDPEYVIPYVEPARTGGDAPSLLPNGAEHSRDNFSINFFGGTEHSETKQAYFEEVFATWQDFKTYADESKATSERHRFQPTTIDGLLSIPAGDPENNNHVILGHAKDGSKKGPFEPIQRGFLEGWLQEGMKMPFTFPDGSTKLVQIENIKRITGKDPSGIDYASPTYYSTWFENPNTNIGVTCLKDMNGDGETDDYIRFNLEIVPDAEVFGGNGNYFTVPAGTFSPTPR